MNKLFFCVEKNSETKICLFCTDFMQKDGTSVKKVHLYVLKGDIHSRIIKLKKDEDNFEKSNLLKISSTFYVEFFVRKCFVQLFLRTCN